MKTADMTNFRERVTSAERQYIASVAELADALDLESCGLTALRVQIPSLAPMKEV